MPVDGARVLTVERNNVAAPAGRVLEVQVRERLPSATQPDDLDIVVAAAVGNGFYDRVEARDIAAAGENADALLRHDQSSTALLSVSSVNAESSTRRVGTSMILKSK